MKNMEKIQAAVCRNRGGLDEATDSQIMIIWNSLSPETQKQYMNSVKEERSEKDAVSNPSKRHLRSGP